MATFIERYPLIVQVVDTGTGRPKLLIHSPDFGFSQGENFEPNKVGQTEILIQRVRDELTKKVKLKERLGESIPSPTLPEEYDSFIGTDVITAQDAARLLRVTRQTIWRMANDGKLKFKKSPGGHRRFLRSEIESILLQDKEIRSEVNSGTDSETPNLQNPGQK